MCQSCKVQFGDSSIKAGIINIPFKGIVNDNLPAYLVWAFCINPDKVKSAFKEVTGENITEDTLPDIIKVHQDGNDIKNYGVNFFNLVKAIKFTQSEMDNATCKVKFVQ